MSPIYYDISAAQAAAMGLHCKLLRSPEELKRWSEEAMKNAKRQTELNEMLKTMPNLLPAPEPDPPKPPVRKPKPYERKFS